MRGAIRLLASTDQMAQDTVDVTERLKAKHPPSPEDVDLTPGPDDGIQPVFASKAEVSASIASFNPGASTGLDGLRPAHLQYLVGRSAGEAGV